MINLENDDYIRSRTAADRIDTSEMVIFAIHCTADRLVLSLQFHVSICIRYAVDTTSTSSQLRSNG